MRVDIFIGGDQVELFAEENLEVNSSVADIEDITKHTTDYTKTFTVPASSENNKLFKHWYDADIDNSFDARIKVDGRIELDGMLFRLGKFRLSKVAVKSGAPSSYTINFWGNLLNLKDAVGKDELSDLDLSAFNHTYDSANVLTGLTTQGFQSDSIVYNLMAKKQYYYNSAPSDTNITDELVNIGWGDGSGDNGVTWNDLRPAIRLIRIIEAIEIKYSLTFSRDFFGRTEFNELYLWLNNSTENGGSKNSVLTDFNDGDFTYINNTTNIGSYPVVRSTNQYFSLGIFVTPKPTYEDVEYTVKIFKNGELSGQYSQTGFSGVPLFNFLNIGDIEADTFTHELFLEIESASFFEYDLQFNQAKYIGVTLDDLATTNALNISQSAVINVSNSFPKIKTLDFLKGLFNAFKLVVIPLDDGTIFVNTLNDYYAEGGIFDITNYVDFDSYDVSRGKILNEINFLFQEPSTILNKQFEENNKIAYGDQETLLKDENGEVLDGDTLEFTLPFEQVLFERLTDINDNQDSSVQYGTITDENLSPVNPKPIIFYNVFQPLGGKPIAFINDIGTKTIITGSLNTPASTIDFNTMNFSTLFDSEFSSWDGRKIDNTLYTNYHEDYLLSIFNIKKRSFNFKTKNVPLRVLLDLELNDILQIKENFYRIDNFTSNLITGEVDFNLVNSFGSSVNSFDASPTSFITDNLVQQLSTYVTNLGNFSFNKVDTGDGVGWVTVTSNTNNVFFDLTLNNTGANRSMFIDLTQAVTLQEVRISITQNGGLVTVDSTTITSDNDIVTADNG